MAASARLVEPDQSHARLRSAVRPDPVQRSRIRPGLTPRRTPAGGATSVQTKPDDHGSFPRSRPGSLSETVPVRPSAFGSRRWAARASMRTVALAAVLVVAVAIRATAVFTQTYVLFVDETFQYLEQGHRLAFGSGLVPWEFQDGARSWLLPGAIAGLMRAGALISDDPIVYLRLIRLLCVSLSLVVVLLGFRARERCAGLAGGVVTGGFCAIWFDPIWFAPAVLTEVIAAHLIILGLYLDRRPAAASLQRQLAIGASFGLALCLRYQYAPAILAVMVWHYRLSWSAWRWVLTAGAAAIVLA